jgi:hypothetical protein
MSPPINIDGSKIEEATIDGQNVTQITIDGQRATNFSDIPDSVVDHFEETLYEDQNNTLSDYYTVDDGSVVSRQQNTVFEGSYALEFTEGTTIRADSGPNRNFSKGEIASSYLRDDGTNIQMVFAVSGGDYYALKFSPTEDQFKIDKFVSNSFDSTVADAGTFTAANTGEWYEIVVERHDGSGSESDGTKIARCYSLNADGSRDSELVNISTTDTAFDANSGVGAKAARNEGTAGYMDRYEYQGDV